MFVFGKRRWELSKNIFLCKNYFVNDFRGKEVFTEVFPFHKEDILPSVVIGTHLI